MLRLVDGLEAKVVALFRATISRCRTFAVRSISNLGQQGARTNADGAVSGNAVEDGLFW